MVLSHRLPCAERKGYQRREPFAHCNGNRRTTGRHPIFHLSRSCGRFSPSPFTRITAVWTINGHREFNRTPFGIKTSGSWFEKLMNIVCSGLQGSELFIYVDDIINFARDLQEHREKWIRLSMRLAAAGVLRSENWKFLVRRSHFYDIVFPAKD